MRRLAVLSGAAVLALILPAVAQAHVPGPLQTVHWQPRDASWHRTPLRSHISSTKRVRTSSAPGSASWTIDGYAVTGTINLTATAYAPTLKDNYPYGPVDYYGRPLVAGDVAVDPSVVPLGTLMWVTGYSSPNLPSGGFLARAVDTGGAIQGHRLDIFINASESVVSNFGIQQVKAYILK